LIAAFAANGELVFGIDDTIERRRGSKIKAKDIWSPFFNVGSEQRCCKSPALVVKALN
jgi:hypothetical protein